LFVLLVKQKLYRPFSEPPGGSNRRKSFKTWNPIGWISDFTNLILSKWEFAQTFDTKWITKWNTKPSQKFESDLTILSRRTCWVTQNEVVRSYLQKLFSSLNFILNSLIIMKMKMTEWIESLRLNNSFCLVSQIEIWEYDCVSHSKYELFTSIILNGLWLRDSQLFWELTLVFLTMVCGGFYFQFRMESTKSHRITDIPHHFRIPFFLSSFLALFLSWVSIRFSRKPSTLRETSQSHHVLISLHSQQ
jgi:hypothetical protein